VMLPQASGPEAHSQPHKFADLAVPALVELAVAHGAVRSRLEAALVGGAAMFKLGGSGQDIGARNEAAVQQHLGALRIPVRASATGGDRGRTIRVHVSRTPAITVREAGGREEHLLGAPTLSHPPKRVAA
jgi:chemotaxis protein CheD